jgi:hypothetical protein
MTPAPLDKLGQIAEVLDQATTTFRDRGPLPAPPPGQEAEHLSALLALREKYHAPAPNQVTDPAAAAGERASQHLGSIATDVGWGVRRLVAEIDQAVAATLDRGVRDPRVVRTADFGALHWQVVPQAGGPEAIYALVVVDSLDADHPLRSLPEGDYYRDASGAKVVVLGRASGDPHALPFQPARPRDWYALGPVLGLTRAWAAQLQSVEAERRAEEARRKAEAERLWKESPAGKEVAMQAKVDTMQRQLAELLAEKAQRQAQEEAKPARPRRRSAAKDGAEA